MEISIDFLRSHRALQSKTNVQLEKLVSILKNEWIETDADLNQVSRDALSSKLPLLALNALKPVQDMPQQDVSRNQIENLAMSNILSFMRKKDVPKSTPFEGTNESNKEENGDDNYKEEDSDNGNNIKNKNKIKLATDQNTRDKETYKSSNDDDKENNQNNNNASATDQNTQEDLKQNLTACETRHDTPKRKAFQECDSYGAYKESRPKKRARCELWKPKRKPVIADHPKNTAWYQGRVNSKFFVRECTDNIFKLIWNAVERAREQWKEDIERFCVFIVTGPPGLGKSWGSNYFLWKLQRLRQNIWFHSASEQTLTIINFMDGKKDPQVTHLFENHVILNKAPSGTWYLYDSVGGTGNAKDMLPFRAQNTGVPCVIFSSPKSTNYKLGLKEMTGGIKQFLWMPAWEWSEIDAVMHELYDEWGGNNRTTEEFREFIRSLFDLWGGIPRRFNDYAKEFRDNGKNLALKSSESRFDEELICLAKNLLECGPCSYIRMLETVGKNSECEGSSQKVNPPSWLLFPCPLKSEEKPFTNRVYKFCSRRAELKFWTYLEKVNSDAVRKFCESVFRTDAVKGIAFERFAHFVLTRTESNNFRWRKYAEETFTQLKLLKCEMTLKCEMETNLGTFQESIVEIITSNKVGIIVPESDQQDAIDMFVVTKIVDCWHVLAMQDTISMSHSFHPVKILEYRAAAIVALKTAKVNVECNFFRHVVVVPSENINIKFSLLPAKHNKKSYWFPPEPTTNSSTDKAIATDGSAIIVSSVAAKYKELGLTTDFSKWNDEMSKIACKKNNVKKFSGFSAEMRKGIGAGAKLLADAEEAVKNWTWVLDGFF